MSLKMDMKLLLTEAVFFLGISQAVLMLVEFKRIAPHLGPAHEKTCRCRQFGEISFGSKGSRMGGQCYEQIYSRGRANVWYRP